MDEASSLYRANAGEPFALAGRVLTVIGRSLECDLPIPDPRVSRRHAVIELVEDQHLLRDLLSSNGTYLNGLRLTDRRAFALRHGDVIEIGDARLIYAPSGRPPELETPSTPAGATHMLPDLLRDGAASFELAELTLIEVAIQEAFQCEGRIGGFERCLAIVESRVPASSLGVFVVEPRGLRAVAARPKLDAVAGLAGLAGEALAARAGRLQRLRGKVARFVHADTAVEDLESTAAVALLDGDRAAAALVASRLDGRPFDRTDLARLAILGERITAAAAAWSRSRGDTRPAFAI